jgi:hypothetical protein
VLAAEVQAVEADGHVLFDDEALRAARAERGEADRHLDGREADAMRQRQQLLRRRDPRRLGVFIGDADALAGVVAGAQVVGGLEEAVADRIVHGLVLGGRAADVGGAVDVDPRAVFGAQRLEDDDLALLERLVVAGAEQFGQEFAGECAAEQQHALIERHDVAGDHERTELAL